MKTIEQAKDETAQEHKRIAPTPHCCPICRGTGNVMGSFYLTIAGVGGSSSTSTSEQCRSCVGTGIIYTLPEAPEVKK